MTLPAITSPHTKAEARRVPVTLDDLQAMESALFQQPGARFSTTQRVFFEALLSHPTLDVVAASKITGVPQATALRWVTQPAVQAALNHLLTTRMKRLGIDKDKLLSKIVDLLEMSMGEAPVIKTGYDKDLQCFISQEVRETDLAAASRFTDQLSKHFQLYAPEGTGGLSVNLQLNMGGNNPLDVVPVPSNGSTPSFQLNFGAAPGIPDNDEDILDVAFDADVPLEDEDFLQ